MFGDLPCVYTEQKRTDPLHESIFSFTSGDKVLKNYIIYISIGAEKSTFKKVFGA